MNSVRLVALAVALLISVACTTNRVGPDRPEALTTATEPIFYPVNLSVWSYEETVPRYVATALFPQIESKVIESGLFSRAEHPGHTPFSLDIRWRYESEGGMSNILLTILRAFTLFLVPAKSTQTHYMTVDVLFERQFLKRYHYQSKTAYWSSLFTDNELVGAKWFHDGVNPMLTSFFSDLEKDGYLKIRNPSTSCGEAL